MRKVLLCALLLLLIASIPGAASSKRVSFEFKNTDLVYVLKALAKEMGRNCYVGPSVSGTVTLKVENMPVEEALRLVLEKQPQAYDYKLVGSNTIVIAPPEKLAEVTSSQLGLGRYATHNTVRAGIAGGMDPLASSAPPQPFNTESYDAIEETGYRSVAEQPLSTFSIDVDTASYSNVRRFLNQGELPPKDAVRIEEMINYFNYEYPSPQTGEPFAVRSELTQCPWNSEHRLLQVALAAPPLQTEDTPPRNLVFLLDVSGSMHAANKLELLKNSLKLLVKTLRPEDRVAIVVYAGAAGEVLPPTSGSGKETILHALDKLSAGGSTNGGQGIELAYSLAAENFQKDAINRIILATDGDFNVGVASRGALVGLIERKRKSGIFLTVLGFGMGNLKDSSMEQLADKGNGNYAYIDNLMEAKKVLVEEAGSTLITVAKDVKVQVEFNPLKVSSYRLIGYENRRLANEDFDNDEKDAGEIGAGHTVTALYEIVPGESESNGLRYQEERQPSEGAKNDELAFVKLRYKAPDSDQSQKREFVVADRVRPFVDASENLRFASSVTAVGMLLSDSEYRGDANFDAALGWARESLGEDAFGYRREFVRLVELAQSLDSAGPTFIR